MKIDDKDYPIYLNEKQIKEVADALKLARIMYIANYGDFEGSNRLKEIIKKMEDLINEN